MRCAFCMRSTFKIGQWSGCIEKFFSKKWLSAPSKTQSSSLKGLGSLSKARLGFLWRIDSWLRRIWGSSHRFRSWRICFKLSMRRSNSSRRDHHKNYKKFSHTPSNSHLPARSSDLKQPSWGKISPKNAPRSKAASRENSTSYAKKSKISPSTNKTNATVCSRHTTTYTKRIQICTKT